MVVNTVSGFNHLTEIIMSLTQLTNDLPAIFPTVFAYDLTRYVIGAGGVYLIVNLLLAARIAARKIRLKEPPDGQVRREILASLRTVLIFACNGTLIVFGARNGVFTIYSDIADYGWWYLGLSSLILIIAHDAWFYWSHRLLHHPPLFRRFHRLHHRSQSSRHDGLLHRASHRTGHADHASGSLDWSIKMPAQAGQIPAGC